MFDLPRKPMIIDDTRNYVHVAETAAEHGNFKGAVDELDKVIESRIHIYIRKSAGIAE